MINLKDEISKFQKLIYNKQLAQFITVDQQFMGQGLTMQSLISQSNFLVEQLKKMQAVMINYCRLNDKIYAKIMEHQLNLHDQNAKIMALVSSVERKAEESQKKSEFLHNQAMHQTNQVKNIIASTINPVKEQLEKKVDKVHFETKIKKILEDYDEGALQLQQKPGNRDAQGQPNDGQLNSIEGSEKGRTSMIPAIRKKGKVGYDQFYNVISKIQQKQKEQNIQKTQIKQELILTKDTVHRYIPIINKNTNQNHTLHAEISTLEQKMKSIQDYSNLKISSLRSQLQAKTNQKVWSQKFEDFYNKNIKEKFQNINKIIDQKERQFIVYKRQNVKLFDQFKNKNMKIDTNISQINSQISDLKRQIQNLNIKVFMNYQQFQKSKLQLTSTITTNQKAHKTHLQTLQTTIKQQIIQIKQSIIKLGKQAQQNIMKMVSKRIEVQIKQIQQNIRFNRQKLQNLRYDIGITCCQIKNIKDILSKKANYADFIVNLEKKADKYDLIQIQKKNQTQQNIMTKQLNKLYQTQQQNYTSQRTSINQSKMTRPMSTNRPTSKTSKAVFLSYSINKQLQKRQQEESKMKQLQHPVQAIIEKRKVYSQTSKRATIKLKLEHSPNTPAVGEFLL